MAEGLSLKRGKTGSGSGRAGSETGASAAFQFQSQPILEPITTAAAAAASPPPPTTLRRNPARRARPPPTPLPSTKPKPSLSRLLDEAASTTSISPPPAPDGPATTTAPSSSSSQSQEERLKVYLRIRPLPERDRCKVSRPKTKDPWKPKQLGGGVCLVATGANSVALTVPQSKLVDPKRGRTEVFDGFSAVFSPDSSQHDIFTQVMNPLVDEFLGGKSGLLVAMGPTGSGKTHTVFGSPRNPGIVPLTLQQIFNARDESKGGSQPTRSFCLSMFEILSEGKGERILDLMSDAADLVLQQSTIKGLKEVTISNFTDAESLVSRGMLKRSTAATNANSKSSRSQCIITIRAVLKSIDAESEHSISSAVLTIADLAGAERERRTGNQGSRLLESSFINNTSMVFGLCLRSLLEHQKNQKKPLEKHFKNSMLTRYLRDYLEGRKKMTLILNVKPGDDDYLDTSFLLRQASPYMKIKYNSLEDSSDLVSQKRSNVSLICQENKKKRKVHKHEVLAVEGKDTIDKAVDIEVSERDEAELKFLSSELRRVSRSEEIMKNFARALWTVLKQYKQKLLESENGAESMRELLRDKDIQIMELKKELKVLNSCCSCEKYPIAEDTSVEQNDAVPSGQAARSLVSLSNQTDLGSIDAALDKFHLVVEEVKEDFTCYGPERSSANCDMKGESDDCDTFVINLIDEQELSSRYLKPEKSFSPDSFGLKCDVKKGNTEIALQVADKELDRSESCSEQTSAQGGGVTQASSHLDHPSDQSFPENHVLACIKSEKATLSPEFTGCSKNALIEQSEEETEELSNITSDIREVKHHDSPSSSQQVNSDTEDISSTQPSLELQWMGAVQQNPQELHSERERCEPTVEKTIVEYGCGRPPNLLNDHGGMFSCLLNERPSPTKALIVPTKDCQAEGIIDKKKDISASKPCNTKKTTRRLLPVAAMMLKEFAGPDMDVDMKREERMKSSSGAGGRSDQLIRLLKAPPVRP